MQTDRGTQVGKNTYTQQASALLSQSLCKTEINFFLIFKIGEICAGVKLVLL